MIVDFQHHYTPPELMEHSGGGALRLDENGNPNYRFNALLADLPAHVRMMDHAGIDRRFCLAAPASISRTLQYAA